MFTSNLTQYITETNVNVSPITCVDTLYYERAYKSVSEGKIKYVVKRQNMTKYMPIGYTVKNSYDLGFTESKFEKLYIKNDYETFNVKDGSILLISGDIHKIDVSIELYNGMKADTNSDYKLFNVINSYNCSLNDCLQNYSTKYQVNSSLNILNNYISSLINGTVPIVSSSINIIYSKVQTTNTSIAQSVNRLINLSTNVDKLNVSLARYGNTITDQDTTSINSMIYTHESLWQLLAHNELVPDNVYNMLYYPKHDVSLNQNNQNVSFYIESDEIMASIINDTPLNTVNTANKTYEPFPYILKLRAVSKCAFAKEANICDYETVMNNYIGNILNIYYKILSPALLPKPYNEVFEYKNICPVIIDIIYNKESQPYEGTVILYDHLYGYIFMQFIDINSIFTMQPDSIYTINQSYRYSLQSVCKNIFDRFIFKKVNNKSSLQNIGCTAIEYKNFKNNFLQSSICQAIEFEFYDSLTSQYIPLTNAIKQNWNIIDAIPYTMLNKCMQCDKWIIRYSYYNNEFTYLKDNYDNEADYNFWNKYISKGIYTGLTYTYASVAWGGLGNIDINIYNNYHLLLEQAYNKNKIAYNNKICNSDVMLISYNNMHIADNNIKNSVNIIIYNFSKNNIKNCQDTHMFNLKNTQLQGNNIKHAKNLIMLNSCKSIVDNLQINDHIIYNYTPSAIYISNAYSYISDSTVNIENSYIDTLVINDCHNISMLYHMISHANIAHAENILLYTEKAYNRYNQQGTQYSMPRSNAIYFDGAVLSKKFTPVPLP